MEKRLTWRGTYMKKIHVQKEDFHGNGTLMKTCMAKRRI